MNHCETCKWYEESCGNVDSPYITETMDKEDFCRFWEGKNEEK